SPIRFVVLNGTVDRKYRWMFRGLDGVTTVSVGGSGPKRSSSSASDPPRLASISITTVCSSRRTPIVWTFGTSDWYDGVHNAGLDQPMNGTDLVSYGKTCSPSDR